MILFEPAERRKTYWQVGYFAFWVVITVIGFSLHPDPSGHGTHQQLGLPPCPSVLLFDRPCPGCGLTTSWTAFLHGQWRASFEAHPLGPLLYLFFTASALLAIYGFRTGRRLDLRSVPMSRFLAGCGMVYLAFGFYRMATTPHFRSSHEQDLVMGLSR